MTQYWVTVLMLTIVLWIGAVLGFLIFLHGDKLLVEIRIFVNKWRSRKKQGL